MVQLADNSGNVVKGYDYDAFGVEKNPDVNDINVFRYCGEYFDKETGVIYLRSRYYDPEIGRFISEDSYTGKSQDPLSLNLYTYCFNDPINFNDPSGHFGLKDIWGGVKKVGSGIGDFVQGVGSGVLESISYGTSNNIEVYYYRDNNTIYLIGKVVGDSVIGAAGGIGTFASGAFTIASSPTIVGAIAGSAATVYCGSITVSGAENAASNVMKIVNGNGSGSNKRKFNVNKQESEQWNNLNKVKGQDRRTSGTGKNKQYYEWDFTHNDIEVYDAKGKHLGSMNPTSGEMYKPSVKGRTIKIN